VVHVGAVTGWCEGQRIPSHRWGGARPGPVRRHDGHRADRTATAVCGNF